MNNVILMGRLTRDPEVRYSSGENQMAIARYTLAVDRRNRKEGGQEADFINCVTFGRSAEFAEKYLTQGIRILVAGRIQTGSYTNREGQKVFTTEVVVENQEFADSKRERDQQGGYNQPQQNNQQNGYNQPQGGYGQPQQNNQQNGYNQPQGGYGQPQQNNQQNGYNQPQGGYGQPQQNNQNNQQNGYGQPQGGYNNQQNGYNQPQGGYGQPQGGYGQPQNNQPSDGFMSIPDNIDDDGLPFN